LQHDRSGLPPNHVKISVRTAHPGIAVTASASCTLARTAGPSRPREVEDERMKEQLGSALGRFRSRGGGASVSELGRLKKRVAELEDEVQENRRLNRRVAELLDIVEELLVPIAQRDEDRVRAYLRAHGAALGTDQTPEPGARPSGPEPE
jgi:hypothetical protein